MINEFFKENPKAAIAFSGGVDSAYLLYAAKQCGAEVRAYYVKTEFQPQFELDDAHRLARELGADMHVIEMSVLECDDITKNHSDRCYHCKRRLFGEIMKFAAADGYDLLLDGTNASDSAGDRPGMRAIAELKVRSPLRECGLTKERIRELSSDAELFTWDKPAYACLATRVPTGEKITADMLQRIEKAEDSLFNLGFTDFRVRLYHGAARVQLKPEQWDLAAAMRERIKGELSGFDAVLLDMECR